MEQCSFSFSQQIGELFFNRRSFLYSLPKCVSRCFRKNEAQRKITLFSYRFAENTSEGKKKKCALLFILSSPFFLLSFSLMSQHFSSPQLLLSLLKRHTLQSSNGAHTSKVEGEIFPAKFAFYPITAVRSGRHAAYFMMHVSLTFAGSSSLSFCIPFEPIGENEELESSGISQSPIFHFANVATKSSNEIMRKCANI